MTWWWRKVRPQPGAPDIDKACDDLRRTIEQRPQVEHLAAELGRHRRMNGFAELVFRPGWKVGPR